MSSAAGRRLAIAGRVVKGWPHAFELGRLFRVPYRMLYPSRSARPLIHKGRKPRHP